MSARARRNVYECGKIPNAAKSIACSVRFRKLWLMGSGDLPDNLPSILGKE
jgi:hypothetical protein